jgi:hypothetical protein
MGNTIRLVGAEMLRRFQEFGVWLWILINKNKPATWFAVSVVGIFISDHPWLWTTSAILAFIVYTGNVKTVTTFAGEQLSTLLKFMIKVMTGQSRGGFVTAMIVDGLILTIIGFVIGNQMLAMWAPVAVVTGLVLGVGKLGGKFKFIK